MFRILTMAAADFVHLHLHSEYSLLDGAIRIPDLVKKIKALGMPAVAITDHGNMFGAIEFYQAATKAKIKPIIGCEVYVAPGKRTDKIATSGKDASFHFTLLVKNEEGYRNLVKLVSAAYLEGFYYKPRIDHEILAAHSRGLIALSGCFKGEIPQAILNGQENKARDLVQKLSAMFEPGDFYLEMHNHLREENELINRSLKAFAREFNLPLVATNDCHFLERKHHEAHDVLICIGTGANVDDEKRMRYSPELYVKDGNEMAQLFADCPEALTNTLEIAAKCDLKLEFGIPKYPAYQPPDGLSPDDFFKKLCHDGLKHRYGVDMDPAAQKPESLRLPCNSRGEIIPAEVLRDRLNYEIGVIQKTGFLAYFLIVWDFIDWAKKNHIPVGPGRGSAAGSLVAYAMGITDCDPIRFELLFERFLNPERITPPDIDVDFCYNRRPEVIEYVRQKYGERAVSNIITFGTLGAKSVIRDVGRVMGLSYGEADRIAKMIPTELGITLNGEEKKGQKVPGAIDKNPELKAAVQNEETTGRLWSFASVLEGLSRNAGVHAAGVVIGDRPLDEYVPLARDANGEGVVTQYAMGPLGDLGMLKMDFLGLKTLTVIQDALDLIQKTQGLKIDILSIPLDDPASFALLNQGKNAGVFQLESGGMVSLCKRFNVDRIDDLIALIALYRPGPMDLIPSYIRRKKGEEKVVYEHPLLESVCSDTYGIMIYQEQVMKAASVLAGYTMGGADLLRRAMGKKDVEKMKKERESFVKGAALTNKIPAERANELFDLIEKFAGYGFNRSHSAAYGLVSYQTAWLKANHPVEFMAALLSNELNNTDKISEYVAECAAMKITILPPDVNASQEKFSVETGRIRYGLAAIKNVGEIAVRSIIQGRNDGGPYESFEKFCERVDSRVVNKKVIESLVKSGAFDSLHGGSRKATFAIIDPCLQRAASVQRDKAAGQDSLFGMLDEPKSAPASTNGHGPGPSKNGTDEWADMERLGYEKELLGFYVTGHPLDQHRETLESFSLDPIMRLGDCEDRQEIKIAGIVTVADKRLSKKDGRPWALLTIEDMTGTTELMIFSDNYEKFGRLCQPNQVVLITGSVETRDEKKSIRLYEMMSIQDAVSRFSKRLNIQLPLSAGTDPTLDRLHDLLLKHNGRTPVGLGFIATDGTRVQLEIDGRFSVQISTDLCEALDTLIGRKNYRCKAEVVITRPASKFDKFKNKSSSPRGAYVSTGD